MTAKRVHLDRAFGGPFQVILLHQMPFIFTRYAIMYFSPVTLIIPQKATI